MQCFCISTKSNPGSHFLLFIPIILGLIVLGCQTPNEAGMMDRDAEEKAILDLLMTQQEDWNNGDIAAFMTGYVETESLRFASGGA
ncbi:MAG: hypothetical protein O7C39_01275, partial [Bacteroidetes bacterium]|nr:hypothetical protein [Bacteroidota bacterium]